MIVPIDDETATCSSVCLRLFSTSLNSVRTIHSSAASQRPSTLMSSSSVAEPVSQNLQQIRKKVRGPPYERDLGPDPALLHPCLPMNLCLASQPRADAATSSVYPRLLSHLSFVLSAAVDSIVGRVRQQLLRNWHRRCLLLGSGNAELPESGLLRQGR